MKMNASSSSIKAIYLPSLSRTEAKSIREIVLIFILSIPVCLLLSLISLMMVIPTRGRFIYSQERMGEGGKSFRLHKFRTLKKGVLLNLEKDKSVIRSHSVPFGPFLRRTGLDELPQFVNVIRREMNFVGPRALLKRDMDHLTPDQLDERHRIKPGITGLWQVTRSYDETDRDFIRPDMYYIMNLSLKLDCLIILKTFRHLFRGMGI